MFNYKACIFAIFFFVCLATAQQQPQQQQQQIGTIPTLVPQTATAAAATATACNYTTVKPTPQANSYVVDTCIVTKFAAYFSLGEGKYLELNDGTVNNASHCQTVNNTVDPMLVVTFPCAELEFEITRNDTKVLIKSINGFYKIEGSPQVTFTNSTPMFETSGDNHYYKCNAEQPIIVNTPNPPGKATLVLSNFAYEAYRAATGTDFYRIPEECALDIGQVSDLVRIGVGICLVALVVIVLIAYFVGRRRWSERSSYESV